jgi:CMP-N,N'-diacetyllegionaminic acid synthase
MPLEPPGNRQVGALVRSVKQMKAYALVPARSGSRGLPDKNILEIDGHPLLAYSIGFAKKLGVDRIIVSTDSEYYREIALKYGAECPYLRGESASTDTANWEAIMADLAANLPKFAVTMPDLWISLKPVNPFRSLEHTLQGIDILVRRRDVDSVRIVSEADARLHFIDEQGFLRPYGNGWDPSVSKMFRFQFPKVYQPYNLEIFRHEGWVRGDRKFMGDRTIPVVAPRITGIDIDDRDTFEMAKALVEARPRPDVVSRHIHL